MKYTARVNQVLHTNIHKLVTVNEDGGKVTSEMLAPDYVEIVTGEAGEKGVMLYRYQDNGTFCGDSWHDNLEKAKSAALYEYGIEEKDWKIKNS